MDFDPVILSRLQFALNVSFHIIFPSFTIGLAAWLATLEGLSLFTGRAIYRTLFDFWLKVFVLAFAMGVVTGIIMALQFGTNWSVLAEKAGSIQGPLLGYEAFTAFMLEATFVGVVILGRDRVPDWFYFFSCVMVALGTTLSSYWIMVNNSWMQVPTGYEIVDGRFLPVSWPEILFNDVLLVRFPHMLLAAYLTTAFCIASTGAVYALKRVHVDAAATMLKMSLGLAAILIPAQIFLGHLNGDYVHKHQPAKFAAIEARWHTEQPASETLIAIPDPAAEKNLYAISIPKLGSFIASGTWDSKEVGLTDFPKADRPPVLIPFFAFRIMVGMGLIMLALSWTGSYLAVRKRLMSTRWFLWITTPGFLLGFVGVLTGWFTAEVGRQPWVVYGLLRTADAHTPALGSGEILISLAAYLLAYMVVVTSGLLYIFRVLRNGPSELPQSDIVSGTSVRSAIVFKSNQSSAGKEET